MGGRRDPVGHEREAWAEMESSTLEQKTSLHCGGQMEGSIIAISDVEEPIHTPLAPKGVASSSPARRPRRPARDGSFSRRSCKNGEISYPSFPFRPHRDTSFLRKTDEAGTCLQNSSAKIRFGPLA